MVIVTYQRNKCIGCNYCVELAYAYWRMNKRDGKSTLLGANNKKEFYTARLTDNALDENEKAAAACPVNIIKVTQI